MEKVLGKFAKVVYHNAGADWEYSCDRNYVDKYMGEVGKIIDHSNSHGECFGIIFRKTYENTKKLVNEDGYYGRENNPLDTYWFEPEEIEIL